jgi:AcrR family transcriptional regulator
MRNAMCRYRRVARQTVTAGPPHDGMHGVNLRTEQQHAQSRRTRTHLLDVARGQLAASETASLNSIAKAAAVGIGTVYRHFPTREDLIFALYRQDVAAIAASATGLLARHRPDAALRVWFERLTEDLDTKAGLAAALRTAPACGTFAGEAYALITVAVQTLLDANERAGTIRPGLTAPDVLLAGHGLYHLDHADPEWRTRAGLLLDILLTGIAAPAVEDRLSEPG